MAGIRCKRCGGDGVVGYPEKSQGTATCPECGGTGIAPIDTDPVGRPGQQQGDQQWPEATR